MIGKVVVGASAAALIAYAAGLVLGGGGFPPPGQAGAAREHVVLFVVATLAVSLLYVGACVIAHRSPPRLLYVLLVGVAARLILLFGAAGPVLEGDRERQRFDGRMVNQGLNPYEFKPAHLGDAHPDDALLSDGQLERLQRARAKMTASDDSPRPEGVQRPDLRTSSTPLGLWIASVADAFKPESSRGYAFLILCADIVAGFLLLLSLHVMRLPLGWLMIYAWCPILLKEAYCTHSLAVFLMPAIAGLVYCIVSDRRLMGAVPLALCVALRPAMLVLLPVVARKVGGLGVLLAVLLALLPLLPFQSGAVPMGNFVEGQVHVWRHYEYNSALENVFRGVLRHVPYRADSSLTIAGVEIVRPDERLDVLLAKVCCIIVLLGVVTYTVIRIRPETELPGTAHHALLTDTFIILAALLLVSPVLRPSHALWLVPILVVRPMGLAWFALPGVLALSYLTHLVGPTAADLTLAGGALSFRIFEYGTVIGLIVVDFFWRDSLFALPEDVAVLQRRPDALDEEAAREFAEEEALVR